MSRQRGFTLVEVLVALVVVALGMAALLETLGSSADTVTWLRERTFAQWIALNQLTLLRLSGQVPSPGQSDGELDYAGRHWRWRQEVSALAVPGVVRIDVMVQPADTPLDDRHWTATVTGGMGDALSPPQLPSLYADPGQSTDSAPPPAPAPPAAATPMTASPGSDTGTNLSGTDLSGTDLTGSAPADSAPPGSSP